jgi:hypothetical protein
MKQKNKNKKAKKKQKKTIKNSDTAGMKIAVECFSVKCFEVMLQIFTAL